MHAKLDNNFTFVLVKYAVRVSKTLPAKLRSFEIFLTLSMEMQG